MTQNQSSFNKVMDDMFSDEINWGTVVGLFVVGGAICVQSVEGDASEPVCHIADWMAAYLDKRINPWIESQGGWKNYPGTLLRPKDASSGLLVDRESSGTSPSAGTGREAVNAALRSMANKFEQDFIQLAGDLSSYGAMTRNQASFNKLMDNMFSDEINWGTVVGLFVVGGECKGERLKI
ncbi:hypothetical protein fugu_015696 [Takifugu bimaculatus]|uniref:Bcl-2 Bcl-2 homology region 1-3 domain-containing protein n=1 Tax=Takifugu bimaculatus TaxID=433685 RepID=A0A4Z2C1I0_9TELE|nr:hypothetical protein fugu_015696 [Takifugu bimaculatus]